MNTIIKCPNCNTDIDVSNSLKNELEREYQARYNKEINAKRAEYKKHFDELETQKREFENSVKNGVDERLKLEKTRLENELKTKLEAENLEAFKTLQAELTQKSKQLSELNLKSAELERVKREKAELEANLKAKAELEYSQKLNNEKERIIKELQNANELKFKQKDEQLEAMKAKILELQRRAEQGSEQAQGEAQELAIEEWLRVKFPLDTITEIKKGANGADCIQIINTREKQNCGKICFESKRTKAFSSDWILKLKNDMKNDGADIGVLVTQTMPKDLERMGMIDGIWVCSYDEFKGLCAVLRQSLISINEAKNVSENRTDKMSMLYSYLTSSEFKLSIESIVDGFSAMQNELAREKRAMGKIWKEREKQIERVLENTINMYGSLRGIAGNAIGEIKTLELEYIADENE